MIVGGNMKSTKIRRILVAILCVIVMLSSSISLFVEGKSISAVEEKNKVARAYDYGGENPDLSLGVYPKRYKVWRNEDNRDHSNEGYGNRYTFGDFGESYDIFNILSKYNAFTFDYYKGKHIVGPVAAGGDVQVSLGGTTPIVVDGTLTTVKYPHIVPCYIGGVAPNNNTITTDSNMPVFINGNIDSNKKDWTLKEFDDSLYKNYYYTNDNYKYIDMEEAKTKIIAQMQEFKDFQGIDVTGNYMKKIIITNNDIEEMKKLSPGEIIEKEGYTLEHNGEAGLNYGIRLKLGYNFEISSVKDVDYIVYDYDSLDEVADKTTFINILDYGELNEGKATVTMPAIFKSIPNDNLGDTPGIIPNGKIKAAYQFGSIEVAEAFNIVGFFPNAINIEVKGGMNKYVGHMVAPKAHVNIYSGDFNGTMIVNSIYSSAEGHMWPFKINPSFVFRKTVNGSRPNENEVFKFKLENISKPKNAGDIEVQEVKNDINGLVRFDISKLTVQGEYIFKISEEYNTQYVKNDNVYYAKVLVQPSSSTVGGARMSAKLEGIYYDEKCTKKHDMNSNDVLYDNIRELKVQKKWIDSDGNELDKQYWDPVSVEIHRKTTKDEKFQPDESIIVDNVDINDLKNNTLVETITLNEDNKWEEVLKGEKYFSSKIIEENGEKVKYDFTYYAKEVNVSSDFTVSYENNDGVILGCITVKNQLDSADLTIQKKSSTGNNNHLSGAEFKLFKSNDLNTPLKFNVNNGYYVFEPKGDKEILLTDGSETDKDSVGLVKIKDLPFGDYVLQETKQPDGFVIDNEFVFIHVNKDGSYYQLMGCEKVPNDSIKKVNITNTSTDSSVKLEFEVENTPNIQVPETGGITNDIYKKVGSLITCFGAVMLVLYNMKFKKGIRF